MKLSRRAALAAPALLLPRLAGAQPAFPNRVVSIVVGVAPGGTADSTARILAQAFPASLGGPGFVVENRPGAGTQIGTAHVARQPADGHTLLVAGAPFAINPGLVPNLPYDTARDFAPITLMVRNGLFLVVPAASPVRDMAGFLALARTPNGANVASAGNASMSHMAIELLGSRVPGTTLTHVPFRGSGLAMPALLGAQVDAMFENPDTCLPHVRDGRLRAIAFTGAARSAAMPEVPTLAEAASLPGYLALNFFGLWTRAGTPEPVLDRLHAATTAAYTQPEVVARFARDGVEAAPMPRAAFAAFITDQMRIWAEVVRERGIKPS